MTLRVLPAILLALSLGLPMSSNAASGLPPLAQNDRVVREFLAAAVGDEIRKNCRSISARIFYALRKANQLENYAQSLGYSDDDITAFRKAPENKALLRGMRDEYLVENGVVKGNEASYCALGRREIESESLVGSLLWARR